VYEALASELPPDLSQAKLVGSMTRSLRSLTPQRARRALAARAERALRFAARSAGYELRVRPDPQAIDPDIDRRFADVYGRMLRLGAYEVRLFTTFKTVEYLVRNRIEGALVECGVLQGKQILMMAHALLEFGARDRDIYLCDTFGWRPPPTPEDYRGFDPAGYEIAMRRWEAAERGDNLATFKRATVDEVRRNVDTCGYPAEHLHYVIGDVLETLPAQAPARIAFLRLDTDFYVSTKHELDTLWDRIVPGGVLVIDDYGTWHGSRQAVDEFWSRLGPAAPMLIRTSNSERLCIKPG
jgi:O-methyltransferase